jgi:hypothetical protein
MMTMIRQSDMLGRSTHQRGELHDLSRQRPYHDTPTQTNSVQSRSLSSPGQGAGHQCRHRREVATASRSHGSFQPTAPIPEGLAARSGAAVELAAEGLVVGSGHGVAGLAADRLPATQSLGGVSGTGPAATASAPGVAAAPESAAWPVPRLSARVSAHRYLRVAAAGWPAPVSVRRHRSGHPADDDAGRAGAGHGPWPFWPTVSGSIPSASIAC